MLDYCLSNGSYITDASVPSLWKLLAILMSSLAP